MRKTRLLESIVLGLILLPLVPAAHAEPGAAAEEVPRLQAPTECAAFAPEVAWTVGEIVALSDCTADCWDGSDRTCSGTSCTAVDSAYPSQRGYCWSNEEGYKYCPVFPTSCPGMSCDDLHGQSCSKFGNTCYGPLPSCEAYTCACWNGVYHCP